MGLLDSIAGNVLGSLTQGGSGSGGLMDAIGGLINQSGGLPGLVERFRQGGLGHAADSWVGTGANLPISADQIHDVLGSDAVKQIAAKLGISPDAAAGQLAQWLPKVVDHATPSGSMADAGDLGELLGKLKGLGG